MQDAYELVSRYEENPQADMFSPLVVLLRRRRQRQQPRQRSNDGTHIENDDDDGVLLHAECAVIHAAPLCDDEMTAICAAFGDAWTRQFTYLTAHRHSEFSMLPNGRRYFIGNGAAYECVLRNEAWTDDDHALMTEFMIAAAAMK